MDFNWFTNYKNYKEKIEETSGVKIKSVFCFTALEISFSVFFKFCKILLFDFNCIQETRNITSL